MSQIYKQLTSSGPIPPTIPTNFTTDDGSIAIPAANNINVFTPGSGTQGIATSASGSTITITLTPETLTGTAMTSDGVTFVPFTAVVPPNVPLPTANTAVSIRANIVGIDIVNGLAVGGELIGLAKNIAGVLTIVGTPDLTKNNDAALAAWLSDLGISGTNIQVQVRGVAGHTIQWRAVIDFTIAP